MIRTSSKIATFLMYCSLAIPGTAFSAPTPQSLNTQINRLVELRRDNYASLNPRETMIQNIKLDEFDELTLVVFTLVGSSNGYNFEQYLAAFSPRIVETDPKGRKHYQLIDIIQVGGKQWRVVEKLDAKVLRSHDKSDISITLGALTCMITGNDAPNKSLKIKLLIKDQRIIEQ